MCDGCVAAGINRWLRHSLQLNLGYWHPIARRVRSEAQQSRFASNAQLQRIFVGVERVEDCVSCSRCVRFAYEAWTVSSQTTLFAKRSYAVRNRGTELILNAIHLARVRAARAQQLPLHQSPHATVETPYPSPPPRRSDFIHTYGIAPTTCIQVPDTLFPRNAETLHSLSGTYPRYTTAILFFSRSVPQGGGRPWSGVVDPHAYPARRARGSALAFRRQASR